MYIIFDITDNKSIVMDSGFPWERTTELLDMGHKVVVISTSSNTVKVPFCVQEGYTEVIEEGLSFDIPTEWDFKDLPMTEVFNLIYNK